MRYNGKTFASTDLFLVFHEAIKLCAAKVRTAGLTYSKTFTNIDPYVSYL